MGDNNKQGVNMAEHWIRGEACSAEGRCFHLRRADVLLRVAAAQEAAPNSATISADTALRKAEQEEDRAQSCPIFN